MATARTRVLSIVQPQPETEKLPAIRLDLGDNAPTVSFEDGVVKIEHPDGSATIDLNPDAAKSTPDSDSDKFDANLTDKIDDAELDRIGSDLCEAIRIDDDSRRDWLETRARGIVLLGLKLEEPRGDTGTSSAPLEGMSTIRHPLLLEATVRFQATARGELLPAGGPVKIRNDTPLRPQKPAVPPVPPTPTAPPAQSAPATPPVPQPGPPMAGGAASPFTPPQPPIPGMPPGQMPPAAGVPNRAGIASLPASQPAQPAPPQPPPTGVAPLPSQDADSLAEALETDFNHYLTVTAKEYVPDTDRMLFYVGFGGDGFKKVYNCPLRRRPVSESVDAKDLIVSDAATDLANCPRVTHQIKMKPSTLKRMQILGAYRHVDLSLPDPSGKQPNPVEEQVQEIQGVRKYTQRPEDGSYDVYETYCELNLDQFAPKQFKGKCLPLPYKVTIEKQSQKVLEIRRNWREDDKECLPKQFFVQFPFIRGLGFYGLGLIHLLGNTTMTLTAAWREMLDNGMFANFPGFLHAKSVGHQLSNQFRVPPGGGVSIDLGAMQDIRAAVMPLPYKETGASHTAFIQHVEDTGQRLGSTAEINIGEGKQDAPVGTTMALLEQATKMMDAVHKRLHAAQAEEFGLLKERFREDPEAFWRHNSRPAKQWEKEQFLQALDDYDLVPVADPNNPTSLHRITKAVMVDTLIGKYQQLMNAPAGLRYILRTAGIDAQGLLNEVPMPPPPDPRFNAIQAKAQAEQGKLQIAQMQAQLKAAELQQKAVANVRDQAARERVEQMKIDLERLRIQQEMIVHMHDIQQGQAETASGIQMDRERLAHESQMDEIKQARQMAMDITKHRSQMSASQDVHQQRLDHAQQAHEQRLEMQRSQAALTQGSSA